MSQYYTKDETNTLLDKKADKTLPEPLKFLATQANSSVGIVNTGTGQAPNIEISTDEGVTWTKWNYSTISLNSGGSVLMRGMNPEGFSKSGSQYSTFTVAGSIEVYGNIMSLIDYTQTVDIIPCDYCFYSLFNGCTSLTTAPALPATKLASSCYYFMFDGCTSLTAAPELSATILAGYCYYAMFRNCSNLTTAPELSATKLADGCYSDMFNGCTSLTTAPELPATKLASRCYQGMFYGCTSLTTAPELPANTLANFCYIDIFNSCSNIKYIKCLATDISAGSCTTDWVSGVASTGTFIKDSTMTSWVTGTYGIPSGWTVVNHYDDIALENKLTAKVESSSITTIWSGTQAEYDAITTKSDNILYIIK